MLKKSKGKRHHAAWLGYTQWRCFVPSSNKILFMPLSMIKLRAGAWTPIDSAISRRILIISSRIHVQGCVGLLLCEGALRHQKWPIRGGIGCKWKRPHAILDFVSMNPYRPRAWLCESCPRAWRHLIWSPSRFTPDNTLWLRPHKTYRGGRRDNQILRHICSITL